VGSIVSGARHCDQMAGRSSGVLGLLRSLKNAGGQRWILAEQKQFIRTRGTASCSFKSSDPSSGGLVYLHRARSQHLSQASHTLAPASEWTGSILGAKCATPRILLARSVISGRTATDNVAKDSVHATAPVKDGERQSDVSRSVEAVKRLRKLPRESREAFFEELRARGEANVFSYSAMISMSPDSKHAEKVMKEMEEAGITPNTVTYNTLIAKQRSEGRFDRALEIFRWVTPPAHAIPYAHTSLHTRLGPRYPRLMRSRTGSECCPCVLLLNASFSLLQEDEELGHHA